MGRNQNIINDIIITTVNEYREYNNALNILLDELIKQDYDSYPLENIKHHVGGEILRCIVYHNRLDVIKFLYNNKMHKGDIDSCLRFAVYDSRLDVIKLLHSLGSDIHYQDDIVMRLSTRFGELDILKYMVRHDSDIHMDKNYAIRYSIIYKHIDVIKYLIENGARYKEYLTVKSARIIINKVLSLIRNDILNDLINNPIKL